jgi:uncharacterized protein YbbK (DUF523 family)
MGKNHPVMISACLLGIRCRYDGHHSLCPDLARFMSSYPFVPFCPEQLGGLPTPRPAARIIGGDGRHILSGKGKLIDMDGRDVTMAFKKGAEEALKLAVLSKTAIAIMKERSPSCGLRTPYCDLLSGSGLGVTAALFKDQDIRMLELGPDDAFPTPGFSKLIKEI